MKKVITVIIVMVMMVLIASVAMADNYTAVLEYLDSMGMREKYEYGKYDEETGVFYYTGVVEMHGLTEECSIEEDWDEKDAWFGSWYENALNERYPEYKVCAVYFNKIASYAYEDSDVDMYNIVVAGTGDLVEYIEGDQHVVSIICAFQ